MRGSESKLAESFANQRLSAVAAEKEHHLLSAGQNR